MAGLSLSLADLAIRKWFGLVYSDHRVGVRSAIHQVLKARGVDPEPLDPFFYPTAEAYKKVGPSRSSSILSLATLLSYFD